MNKEIPAHITLGYSTGIFYPETDIKKSIKAIAKVETNHLELNFGTPNEIILPDRELLDLISTFSTKDIHAPFKNIRYSQKSEEEVNKLFQATKAIKADAIIFHPDTVDDFKWLYNKLGSLITYENMDNRKKYGNKIEELEVLFQKYPSTNWLCDVNHLYTMDPTLETSKEFHNAFNGRLYGYHLSGYGSSEISHTCLYLTQENQIIDAIVDFSKPIIHEGGAPSQENFLEKEHKYVLDYINKKRDNT